jgi:hypothetical protein
VECCGNKANETRTDWACKNGLNRRRVHSPRLTAQKRKLLPPRYPEACRGSFSSSYIKPEIGACAPSSSPSPALTTAYLSSGPIGGLRMSCPRSTPGVTAQAGVDRADPGAAPYLAADPCRWLLSIACRPGLSRGRTGAFIEPILAPFSAHAIIGFVAATFDGSLSQPELSPIPAGTTQS